MSQLSAWIFSPSGLTPHGFCLLWEPGLLWTQAFADLTIGLSYFSIPLVLIRIASRRGDLVFKPLFSMFAVFIVLCGTGHWLDLLTLWVPAYNIQAAVGVATAAASAVTAATLWPLLPRLLALPSPAQMRAANEAVVKLAEDRGQAIAALRLSDTTLRHANETLEARVAERTSKLTEMVDALRKEANDRVRAEEALRQSQKMEAVGQLTGGIAHDFNNMLAGISGSLELIRLRIDQGRTQDLPRYIESALTSTMRAAALTQRLLAFSRRQTLDPKPTDLNRLVVGMEELFTNTVGPAIQVATKLDTEIGLTLCDQNQLENALLNLVINARDAMPAGGSLFIETTNVVLPDHRGAPQTGADLPPGDYVALGVTDTGIGMAPHVLAQVFEPFFTTKPFGQGTGLGLSMVYGFAQQSGGQVLLRSAEGQGTTGTIYLRRLLETVESEIEVPVVVPRDASASTSAVVLVVEDEVNVRMVAVDVLRNSGYTVLEAEDGSCGLNILRSSSRIDLLVSDVGLPGGMNGRQLADAARELRAGLKVLFITGYSEGVVDSTGRLETGMQVLTKPFPMDVFATRVDSMINS